MASQEFFSAPGEVSLPDKRAPMAGTPHRKTGMPAPKQKL
jgi:hypothetical protein